MAALAHGWQPPPGSGIHIPLAVAVEFNKADEGTGIRNRRTAGALQQMQYRGPERRHPYGR
jgi:hypothetical protein